MGSLTTPKGGKTNTTTQVNEVPAYVQQAQQNLINSGRNVLSPWIQPQNFTQAPVNADTMATYDLTRNLASQAMSSQPQAPQFDPGAYLGQNPDVAAYAKANGYDPNQYAQYHYGAFGGSEGRAQPMTPEVAAKNPVAQVQTQKLGDLAAPINLLDYRNSPDWKAPAAASTYNGSTYNASTYNPSTYNAAGYAPNTYNAASFGPSSYSASTVGGNEIQALLNPYTQSVVDTTAANMRRSLNASQAGEAAKAAASGYQGGSRQAVASAMMDRDFQTNLASTTAQLMAQGYDKATATALANASATQSAASNNAQLQQQAAAANAGALNTANQFNSAAANTAGQFNAGATNTANQTNTAAANAAGQFNAGAQNTAGQFNAGSLNTAGQFNAGAQNTRDSFNASQGSNMLSNYNQNALNLYQQMMLGRNTDNNTAIAQAQAQEALKSGDFARQQQAIALLSGIGQQQNQIYQNSLDTPLRYLQALQGITPQQTGSTTTTNSPNTAASPLQTILGGASSLLGMSTGGGSTLLGKLIS